MNYNDNKNNKQGYQEDFDIKSHLNESLDLSGITVSEELINKTLNAIKNQSSQVESNDEINKSTNQKRNKTNRIVLWNGYVRKIAGAAAVVLVVFAGFSMMRVIGTSSKKDSATPHYAQNSTTAEDKQSDETSTNSQNELDSTDVLPENDIAGASKEYASKADTSKADNSKADNSKADTAQTDTSQADTSQVKASQKADRDTGAVSETNLDVSVKKSSQTSSGAMAKKSTAEDETAQMASGSTSSVKSAVKGSKKEASKEQKSLTESVKTDQQVAENAMPKTGADRNEKTDATDESVPKMALRGTIADDLKFINICPLSPEEISSIKISIIASGTSISITNLSEINDFSTRMEKYQFSQATDASDSGAYLIEIQSPNASPGLYTITVGNNITVRYTMGEQIIENRYQSVDMEGLKNELYQIVTKN